MTVFKNQRRAGGMKKGFMKMRKSLHCINDSSLLIHWLQTNCHDPPEPWAKKCDVHDQPEHSTHRTVLLKRHIGTSF